MKKGKELDIDSKFIVIGWAIIVTFLIILFSVLNKEPPNAEELNGYEFTVEEAGGDVMSQITVWVFVNTRTATVERKDIINNTYIPDVKNRYSVKLTYDQLYKVLDAYEAKKETGEMKNTPYDRAVINAMSIIKSGKQDEALKELELVLQEP